MQTLQKYIQALRAWRLRQPWLCSEFEFHVMMAGLWVWVIKASLATAVLLFFVCPTEWLWNARGTLVAVMVGAGLMFIMTMFMGDAAYRWPNEIHPKAIKHD